MVKFSIIIPVAPYRDAPVVDSLKKLKYKDYEVIVEKGFRASENRNKGVKKSKGDIILFLDDDGYVSEDLLSNALNFFEKYKDVSIVGGPQLTPKSDKWFARISGYAIASFFGTQNMSKRYKKGKVNFDAWNIITSAVVFVRKEVFEKVKFNPDLFPGEDPEFFNNAKKNGFKIAYSPDLVIYHKRRDTLRSFLKQFYLYGKVRIKTGHINLLFFLPSFFVLYLIFLSFLSFFSKLFLIPLLVYFIISILFAFYESIKNKSFFSVFLLPFFYFCIHVSYGVGLLIGIINKLVKD